MSFLCLGITLYIHVVRILEKKWSTYVQRQKHKRQPKTLACIL